MEYTKNDSSKAADDRRAAVLGVIAEMAQARDAGIDRGLTLDQAEQKAKADHFEKCTIEGAKHFARTVIDSDPSLARIRNVSDSAKGIFLQRNLKASAGAAMRYRKPGLDWINGGLVAISSSLPNGAESFDWQEIDHVGEAELIGDYADDTPLATIDGRSYVQKIHEYGIGHQYSRKELRRSAQATAIDIAIEKGRASAMGNDLKLDKLIFEGDTRTGATGLINTAGTMRRTSATSGWASTATADQIIAAFSAAYVAQASLTSGVEMPDTVVMPVDVMARIKTLRQASDNSVSVLTFLRESYPEITEWRANFRMATGDLARTGPAMLMYCRAPECVEAQIPFRMLPVPVQYQAYKSRFLFETAFGGLKFARPKSCLVLSGI